jgi:L-threonylcarbamoyladenylate synthase
MRVIKADTEVSGLEAVEVLNRGGLIAYPTESFYALGVRFDIETALLKLHRLKGRTEGKAFPLIIPGQEALDGIALNVNETARKLMNEYWPGPLTFVIGAIAGLSEYVTEKGTTAVRVPGESFALTLVRESGFPITATSANPSGSPPACDVLTVLKYFSEGIDLVVDGGTSPGGLPSTLVDVTGKEIKIIRAGAVKINAP